MKNCIICGAVINDADVICPACGSESAPVEKIVNDQTNIDSNSVPEKPADTDYSAPAPKQQQTYNPYLQGIPPFVLQQRAQGFPMGQGYPQGQGSPMGQDYPQRQGSPMGQGYLQGQGYPQVDPYYNDYTDFQINNVFQQEAKKGKIKKIAIISGAIALAVAAFLVVFFVFVNGVDRKTSKSVVEQYVNAISNKNESKLRKLLPDELITDDDIFEENLTSAEKILENLKSYKILSETEIDETEELEYIDRMRDKYNLNVSDITCVEVEIVLDEDGEKVSDMVNFVVAKIDSKWYVIDDELVMSGNGVGPTGVAERCFHSFLNGDADVMFDCYPEGMFSKAEREALRQTVEYLKTMDIGISNVRAEQEVRLSDDEAEFYVNQLRNSYNIEVTEVTRVPISYRMDYMGITDEGTLDIICGKVGNKWYVIEEIG